MSCPPLDDDMDDIDKGVTLTLIVDYSEWLVM